MKIIRVKNYQELSKKASEIFISLLKEKPSATLGLATGSSPIGLYQNLVKSYQNKEISFKNVKTFNLDEYCKLPKDHPESYYSFMYRNLFSHVDINKDNIHLPSGEAEDLQEECLAYNNLLKNTLIDLQVLGIGSNGHIGFNEPGTPFKQETFIVTLAQKTREDNKRFFNSLDEVPTQAITMGINNIMQAKKIVLIASGKSKANAINKLVNGPLTEAFPASILQNHPDVTIIVDEEAASLL